MSENLDIHVFEQMVSKHFFMGFLRHSIFSEIVSDREWNFDLERGEIIYAGLGTYPIQLLGTVATDGFLWAWANPHMSQWASSVYKLSLDWKSLAEKGKGLAVFKQPMIYPDLVKPLEIAAVCSQIAKKPFWIAAAGAASALLIVDYPIEIPRLSLSDLGNLVLDAQPLTFIHNHEILIHFLEQLNFSVQDSARETIAIDQEGHEIKFEWSIDPLRVISFSGNLWI